MFALFGHLGGNPCTILSFMRIEVLYFIDYQLVIFIRA